IRILSNWFWGKRAWRCNSTSPNTSSAALAIHDPAWHSALAMVIISPFLNSEFRTPHTAFHLYPSGPVPRPINILNSSLSTRPKRPRLVPKPPIRARPRRRPRSPLSWNDLELWLTKPKLPQRRRTSQAFRQSPKATFQQQAQPKLYLAADGMRKLFNPKMLRVRAASLKPFKPCPQG